MCKVTIVYYITTQIIMYAHCTVKLSSFMEPKHDHEKFTTAFPMYTVNGTIRGTLDENLGQPYRKNCLSALAEFFYAATSPQILNTHKISVRLNE